MSSPTGMFFVETDPIQITMRSSFVQGEVLEKEQYNLQISVSQEPIGKLADSNQKYELCLGILCSAYEPRYDIRVKGNLSYSTGEIVANSEITTIIEYGSYEKQVIERTNAKGIFEAVIIDVPENIRNSEFIIKIYAEAEIEAVYECIYNPTTDICS